MHMLRGLAHIVWRWNVKQTWGWKQESEIDGGKYVDDGGSPPPF